MIKKIEANRYGAVQYATSKEEEVALLPIDVAQGSICVVLENTNVYMFDEADKEWKLFVGGSSTGGGSVVASDKLVETPIVDSTLNLTTDKYQLAHMKNNTQIVLPTVDKYTEIHLFFNTTEDLTLTLPSVKWQKQPNIVAYQVYELTFKFINGFWIGDSSSYYDYNSPVMDSLVCWLDGSEYEQEDRILKDKSGHENNFIVEGTLVKDEKNNLYTDGKASFITKLTLQSEDYSIFFSYESGGMYMNAKHYDRLSNLFFIEGTDEISVGATSDDGKLKIPLGTQSVCVTFNSTNMERIIYFDGVKVNSKTFTSKTDLSEMVFTFGKKNWENKYSKTLIGNVLIYNKPLTSTEVEHNQKYLKTL